MASRAAVCFLAVGSVQAARVRESDMSMRNDDFVAVGMPGVEMTVEGCECTNECGATTAEFFRCDWCNVPRRCASWLATRGHHDFCKFQEEDSYRSLSHDQKMRELWAQVTADTSIGPSPTKRQSLPRILSKSMITSFDNSRDLHPDGRIKDTHANGVVCQFDFEVNGDSPYTGMLRPGTHKGLMRLASARHPDVDGTFPGVGFKFLRSGIHSANFVTLRKAGEQSGHINFFEKMQSTHVSPGFAGDVIQKLQQATHCRSMLGLSDVASFDEDGNPQDNINFPYEITMDAPDPMYLAVDPNAANKTRHLLDLLESIPRGKVIYNVSARASPTSPVVPLGTIRTSTECTTSLFGDSRLFFRHQRMEEDFNRKPEWADGIDMPFCEYRDRDLSSWKCPGVDGIMPLPL